MELTVDDRKQSVILLGSYPPNYGGISVHMWRLHQALRECYDVDVLDMYAGAEAPRESGVHRLRGNPFTAIFRARRLLDRLSPDILHVHVSAFARFLLSTPMLLTSRGSPYRILTIHGGKLGQNLQKFNGLQNKLFDWALSRFDYIVCVSAAQRDMLLERGIEARCVSVVNAYLPPLPHQNRELFAPLIERRESGKTLLLITSPFLKHYGLLELLHALHRLPDELRRLICLSHVSYLDTDAEYAKACEAAVGDIDYVHYRAIEPPDMAAWLALGDVYVRPTWWDGDAVSLREACFFGNRIVATDVATRPEGAILCPAKDERALAAALRRALGDANLGVVQFDHEASKNALMDLYDAAIA